MGAKEIRGMQKASKLVRKRINENIAGGASKNPVIRRARERGETGTKVINPGTAKALSKREKKIRDINREIMGR